MGFIPIFDAIAPVISKVLSFIPDPQERQKQEEFLVNSLKEWDSQQTQINLEEAKNEKLFVSGWRPFIGWVCGVAFAYHYLVEPMIMLGVTCYRGECVPPTFDMSTLMQVLLGMLGLGSLRTVEKLGERGHLPWQK